MLLQSSVWRVLVQARRIGGALAICGGGLLWGAVPVAAQEPEAAPVQIKGAGASFPSLVYGRWASRYSAERRGAQVSYQATGSGDGVKQARARSASFAGTDVPLSPQQLAEAKLVQIPMLVGGLVPVVNLPGVASNELLLDGPVLADLMLARITRWDDPRIARLNPRMRLPALPVTRVVRSDASGSTEMFMRYLSVTSPDFRAALPVSQLPCSISAAPRACSHYGKARAGVAQGAVQGAARRPGRPPGPAAQRGPAPWGTPARRVISAHRRLPRCSSCPGGQPGLRRAPCRRLRAESREPPRSVNRP